MIEPELMAVAVAVAVAAAAAAEVEDPVKTKSHPSSRDRSPSSSDEVREQRNRFPPGSSTRRNYDFRQLLRLTAGA